jgi:hypothetical protein
VSSFPGCNLFEIGRNDPIWGHNPEGFWLWLQNQVEANRLLAGSESCVPQVTAALREWLASGKTPMLAFDDTRRSTEEKFVQIETIPQNQTVWFIGDLHGDLLSYYALDAYITRQPSDSNDLPHKVCFLGDLVDDGLYDGELLVVLFEAMLRAPGSIAFVAGNHDEGIYRLPDTGEFRSSVIPSNFCDRINATPQDSCMRELASAAILFFQQAPRAYLFPDGLLVAHGGVPHVDLHPHLRHPEDFSNPQMLADFVWTRLHPTAKRKIPNRTTRGCSLGAEDFDAFCDHAAKILGRPITGMLRGHDHVPDRYLVHPEYRRHPVITINAMCSKQRDVFGPWERKPVAVKWRNGQALEIHQIEIPEWLIARFYPKPLPQGDLASQDRETAPEP